jgi:hypothetical protein
VIKTGRLKWLGHIFRMQELDPRRRLIVLKPEGIRRARKLKVKFTLEQATKAQTGSRGIALLFP